MKKTTGGQKGDREGYHVVSGTLQAFGQQSIRQASNLPPCNALFQSYLDEREAPLHQTGWRIPKTTDDGEIHICVFQASTSRKEDLVTVALKIVTPEVARFLFQLLLTAAVKDEKSPFNLVTSENELLDISIEGPYQWWCRNTSNY